MFIIHGYPEGYDGDEPKMLAAYRLTDDGIIIFDEKRCDPEFLAGLQNGVSVMCDDGEFVTILPDQGQVFHEACQHVFASMPLAWADERELDRLRRQFPSPHHSLPPASVA